MEYDTNYLTPDQLVLGREGDSLLCTIGDETHRDVQLKCAFPMSYPGRYIVLKVPEKGEIGVIRDLNDLETAQREIVLEEMKKTYFVPVIMKILSVEEEFGVSVWDVETDRGRCTIKVRRRGQDSVTDHGDGRIILTDVDSNRFEVADVNALDSRSRSLLARLI